MKKCTIKSLVTFFYSTYFFRHVNLFFVMTLNLNSPRHAIEQLHVGIKQWLIIRHCVDKEYLSCVGKQMCQHYGYVV